MSDVIKVVKLSGFLGGIISEAEAKEAGIDITGKALASINDCRDQVEQGDLGDAYGGPIQLSEGIFEFNFDTQEYEEITNKELSDE